MHEKYFKLKLMIFIAMLSGLSFLLAYILFNKEMLFAPLIVALCILVTTVSFIGFIDRSSKELTRFLLSLREGAFTDFTQSAGSKNSLALSETLNEVTREFAKVNLEKHLHFQYLQTLNENMGVGIVTFNEDGSLRMLNPAARKMLKVTNIQKKDAIREIDKALYEAMLDLKPEEKRVLKISPQHESFHISVQMKEIVVNQNRLQIYFLQNIHDELDQKELEAWQQLIRVLTHEIMNSVTPISSLSKAIISILRNEDGSPRDLSSLSAENVSDIHESLHTIASRSTGLMKFVTSYKEYARLPQLRVEEVQPLLVVERILTLMKPAFDELNIQCSIFKEGIIRPQRFDVSLVEQVIINLLKNGIDAVAHDGSGRIDISVKNNPALSITITDNGNGIDEETLSKIFVPFFTTKPKGTGIGLSLSRQIMKLHGGQIGVKSIPGKGSSFTVQF